jgi:ATP-dependent DNA helicase RecG
MCYSVTAIEKLMIKKARNRPGSAQASVNRLSDRWPLARTHALTGRCAAARGAAAISESRLSWGAMASLDERLDRVLGPKTAKVFANGLDLHTAGDLLSHYPRRYERHGELTDMASLRDGEQVTVLARIASVTSRRMRRKRGWVTEVRVTDGDGVLILLFFQQQWLERTLRPGLYGLFAGEVSTYERKRQLVHPDFELIGAADAAEVGSELAAEYVNDLIPVYPATAKLASWKIAKAIQTVLDPLDIEEDPLPEDVRQRHGLHGLAQALRGIHRPLDEDDVRHARRRLKWDEAFVLQAALAQRRFYAAALPAKERQARGAGLLTAFDARLPFTLTAGQRDAGATIAAELAREHPMHRLLQGEVGSGKTVIAIRAMLQVIDAGGQAALLAPTEVLAQQHYRSISGLLGPLSEAGQLGGGEVATRVTLLTGSQGAKERRAALLDAASGAAGIVIGTHALLQEHVQFADLGLVVIDEQHRFGVEQRDALREKARDARPHVLVMTATPIPRTVAMTVYGDLDISTLTELPAGREAIATHVVPAAEKPHYLERTWERLREEVGRGRQAYVVCPRIGEDGTPPGPPDQGISSQTENPPGLTAPPPAAVKDHRRGAGGERGGGADGDSDGAGDGDADVAEDGNFRRSPLAVLDVAPMLEQGPLAGLRLRILHGRLPADEKDAAMRAFADGSADVLVATTVVEVGVDVPNATVMVILDAERFGVSQLHQLRGRVGRGTEPGLCLLVTEAPEASPPRDRLDAVAATLDGFELSRLDLAQRREGDVLGAAQAGRKKSLKLLTLLADEDLIREARQEATAVVDGDPLLASHPALAAAITAMLDEEQAEFLEKA